MGNKILLSTDIGSDIDDALSLLSLLNHPGINITGVYTVNGDVDSRSYIAKQMVNLNGKKVNVAKGQSKPIGASVMPYSLLESNLVDEEFIDEKINENNIIYKDLEEVGIIKDGISHLAEELSKDKYVILSIGPLTNIAKILKHYKKASKNIEELYLMGFRFPEGSLEHNIRYDSVAAQIVLDSQIPITIIPANICSKYKPNYKEIEKQLESKTGNYVKRMLKAFVGGKVAQSYRSKYINQINLERILKDFVNIHPAKCKELSPIEIINLEDFKKIALENFTTPKAYTNTDLFWCNYEKLIKQLKNPKYNYTHGKEIAKTLKSLTPNGLCISDVYVPFCFLNKDEVKLERKTLSCDFEGRTIVKHGRKHKIVKEININSLKDFTKNYLR